jgi:glyoxylase-like metal-dependent hydrolase (beta-lactamase superfamily II)
MKRVLAALLLFCGCATAPPAARAPEPAGFRQPNPKHHPDLYVWSDTCNSYVIREGEAAILIDLGDGSVLDRLGDIGVKRVEWVLFTHHHREQLQGYPKLKAWNAKVAGPELERDLFEKPSTFRKMQVKLGDRYTIHGASYVRPPIQPVPLDRGFRTMDTFEWRGREFSCYDTRGNSPGSMTYALKRAGRWLAFTGDLMTDGARMHTWFDSEWDYGFAAGVHALTNSAGLVAGIDPAWLLPSHGPPVPEARAQLVEYQEKLRRFEKLLVRGYDVHTVSGSWQDKLSRPTDVPFVWRTLPHLYKFRGPNFYPNFSLLIADSGRGLAFDCGLLDPKFLDQAIAGMKERLGLKSIDAVLVSHMHGDHMLQAPHLREKYGTKIWAIDRMGPVCERPEDFDYCAPIQAYGTGVERVKFDRLFKDGERFEWEGYTFQVDWMPGQTEFALAVWGMIDGKKVVFTGDNLFGDPDDPTHTGHEAMVAHNSGILEEGYIYGAEYLSRLKPDLIMGGHSYVMNEPAAFVERYRRWAYAMRDAFRTLSPDPDYEYFFDPYWVRVEPYRARVKAGSSVEVQVHVRNFRSRAQSHRIEVHAPPGLATEPAEFRGELAAKARGVFRMTVKAAPDAKPGVHLVAFDPTLDGRRYGEWFDLVVEVTP